MYLWLWRFVQFWKSFRCFSRNGKEKKRREEKIFQILVVFILQVHVIVHKLLQLFLVGILCSRLFQVRGKIYELLTNCIPPEIILKVLTDTPDCLSIVDPWMDFNIFILIAEATLWTSEEIRWWIKAWGLPLGSILCELSIDFLEDFVYVNALACFLFYIYFLEGYAQWREKF